MSSKRIGLPGRPRREAPNYRINGWMYSLSLAAAVAAFALVLSFDIDVSRPLAKLSGELSYAFRPLTDSPSDDQIAAPLLVGRLLPEARSLGELLARLRGRVSPVLIGDPEYDSKSAAPSPAWASTST